MTGRPRCTSLGCDLRTPPSNCARAGTDRYPQALALPVSNALASIAGWYDRIFAWDPMNATIRGFSRRRSAELGQRAANAAIRASYWVHATQDASLNISHESAADDGCARLYRRPANTSTISAGAITLAEGITLTSVTVDYWPVNDLNAAQVLVTGIDGTAETHSPHWTRPRWRTARTSFASAARIALATWSPAG